MLILKASALQMRMDRLHSLPVRVLPALKALKG